MREPGGHVWEEHPRQRESKCRGLRQECTSMCEDGQVQLEEDWGRV